ncbi:hypothetical protein [Burkholderia sp. BE17]|uniref:hypothetical protein n=1 Tax=Burkholderia sp. BE17 TaxID=2656644 RepID=UPI001D10F1B3|nr:hypothetical protein [Burkholderia sp. BE17]
MLLPLSTQKVRALSLENHLAFATVRAGRGDSEQIINLLRIVYLAFYLRDETAYGANLDLYRLAEAALDACVERAEAGEEWLLVDHEQVVIERLLTVHENLSAFLWARRLNNALSTRLGESFTEQDSKLVHC